MTADEAWGYIRFFSQDSMEITRDRLKQIIIRILKEQAEASQKPQSPQKVEAVDTHVEPSAYVLCESGHEAVFLGFLRENKKSVRRFRITVVLETPGEEIVRTLISEGLCDSFVRPDAVNDSTVCSLTVYPSFRRASLCEAALGMDTLFASKMLRKDFEAGRRPVVLLNGLESFTGKEPKIYKEKILSYIRSMAEMGVRFVKGAGGMPDSLSDISGTHTVVGTGSKETAKKAPLKKSEGVNEVYELKTQNNLVTAGDIRQIRAKSTVLISGQKILTPLAWDAVKDLNLKIVRK